MSKEELVEKNDKDLKIQECKDEIKKYFLERLDAETDDNSSYDFFEQKVYTIMGSKEVYDIIEKYGCTRNDVGIYSNYYEDLATKKFEALKRIQECKDEIKKYFLERLDAETDDNSSYVCVEWKKK